MITLFICIFFAPLFVHADNQFTNEFAVEMDMDPTEAELDLSPYKIKIVRHVSALGNVYHIRHQHDCSNSRCKRQIQDSIVDVLLQHPLIHRVEAQYDLEVEKKDLTEDDSFWQDKKVYNDPTNELPFEEVEVRVEDLDKPTGVVKKESSDEKPKVVDCCTENDDNKRLPDHDSFKKEASKDDAEYQNLVRRRKDRLSKVKFNDPETENLWQFNNYGQFDINPGFDMNIFNVYDKNITGRGVVLTVVDDGIDTIHREIEKNFDPSASIDLNDPENKFGDPRGPHMNRNIPLVDGHGTSCASLIAGQANNKFCGFGVAYNANIGGIRILARNMVTDLLEAYALTHNYEYIDIYSNSWGPKDTGTKTAPISYYVNKALKLGSEKGRNGKGSIFLFAAGNGGVNGDNCGADGLVNSPYTIACTSVNIYGRKPAYTEECSAVTITAAVGGHSAGDYFKGDMQDPVLIASKVNNQCLRRFVGTSAATPVIGGCIALALEANPDLTWRDVQHLFTISSRIPNSEEAVWQMNTAGILVSHIYGFGLLDCSAMVRNSQMWETAGQLRQCLGGKTNEKDSINIRSNRRTRISFRTHACQGTANEVQVLEHVVIHTKIEHPCRGDIAIVLTSPTRTKSFLLRSRRWDYNNKTITFSHLSLMNWGEDPVGTWELDIADNGLCGEKANSNKPRGRVLEASITFFGTTKEDSVQTLNYKLFQQYFNSVGIKKPKHSYVLDDEELYKLYNSQRKYFINVVPLHKKSGIVYKEINNNIRNKKSINHFHQILSQMKKNFPDEDLTILYNLLNNTNA